MGASVPHGTEKKEASYRSKVTPGAHPLHGCLCLRDAAGISVRRYSMPTKLLFAPRRAGRLGRSSDQKQKPAHMLSALAALAAVLLSASTARLDASAGPASAPTASLPELVPLATPPSRGFGALPANVDALVAALARKYRVSAEATREMVDAAYVEGGRNGLDPLLIIAVIGIESRFNPIAQSDGGALGLMQIIPRYHGDKFDAAAGESVLDPRVNIQVGAAVLREYIRRAGTEEAGLQLYNGSLDDETSTYAHKVLAEKQRLKWLIRHGA
jgi:soluble lytic murein transglycosylase-like protein